MAVDAIYLQDSNYTPHIFQITTGYSSYKLIYRRF